MVADWLRGKRLFVRTLNSLVKPIILSIAIVDALILVWTCSVDVVVCIELIVDTKKLFHLLVIEPNSLLTPPPVVGNTEPFILILPPTVIPL